jgi:hypothetical protein
MKMKQVLKMKAAVVLLAGLAVLGSCKKTDDTVLSSDDTQNVNSETVADTQISETSDLSSSVVTNVTNTQYATGRITGVIDGLASKDPRLTGAVITITPGSNSTKDNPNGTIVIDFGAGQTYNGVTRKGQIIITYSGKKGVTGSTRTLGYNGYSRNGIAFDNGMTFTHTNITDSTVFHHVLDGGKLTFPDNTTITRVANYDVTLDYINKTLTLSAHNGASHSAAGVNRKGKEYTMDIITPIVYKAECATSKIFLAASGKKTISAGLITYTIDYGDGTCDNTVTITVGGKTITITASADGN